MRRFTTLLLAAFLTLTFTTGSVAAKPKDGKSNNGAITVQIRESGSSDRVGAWSCAGVYVKNKNHTRVNAECTIEFVGPYAGTYTSETHDVPAWLSGDGSGYLDDAIKLTGISEADLQDMQWRVVVTPNGDGSGSVEAVALLD